MLIRLTKAISSVCPIDGVSGVQGNVRIDYRPEATPEQLAAAKAALASFEWSQAAQDAWLEDQQPERKAIRQAAANAIADNDTFLVIATPTNAQTLAQVRRLTQQNNRIIQRLIQID